MIHVCSLARLHATVEDTGARHVVSLLGDEAPIDRPTAIVEENHLWLRMHDISSPLDGYILPDEDHVADLLSFVRRWDRSAPLVVHCYAGISRSTASAFTTVCALNPQRDETSIAQALRRASPHGDPEHPHRLARRPAAWPRRPHGRGDRNHWSRRNRRGRQSVPAGAGMSLSSFRGATELGCSRVRTHSAKSATADLDGSEPESITIGTKVALRGAAQIRNVIEYRFRVPR